MCHWPVTDTSVETGNHRARTGMRREAAKLHAGIRCRLPGGLATGSGCKRACGA